MSARAALLIGLVAVLLCAPANASAEPVDYPVDGWAPIGAGWTVTESFDSVGTRGDCAEGHVTRWATDSGQTAGLVWARCGDAATAAALLDLTWSSQQMYPVAGVAPAFGEGLDLTGRYPGFDGLNRLWTQGEWFVTVGRSCAPDQLASCDAATAEDARQVAALVGVPVDQLRPVQRVPGDYFVDWSPSDDNGWYLSAADRALAGDLERCEDGVFTTWTGLDGGAVEAFWVRCADPSVAFQLQHERWLALTDAVGLTNVFGQGYDRASRYGTDVRGVTRSWVQGDLYVNVQRSCPQGDLDVCASATAGYATELAALLPGEIVEDTTLAQATNELLRLAIAVPLATFLLLLLPQRVYFWWRSRGYSVQTDEPNFTPVDALVRRVRIGRIVRRVILTIAVVVTWFFSVLELVTGTDPRPWVLTLQLLYVLLSPFVFFALFGFVLRLVWRPHRLIGLARRRGRPTGLGILGNGIRLIATAFAGLSVILYFFATLMLITDREKTEQTVAQEVATGFTLDPFAAAWAAVRWAVHALDATGTYLVVFLIMLVVPVTIAYLLDRFGQRLTRRSLQATLATDDRPYFLYLRGFDEDRLRTDESVGRRGFLELFTPFGRPRFEEVLVEYLTQYGPVIAIAGAKQMLSDLGAAKVSLGNDEWRAKVQEWSAGARAVVMSATPREVRAGLEWEMEHVAANAGDVRIMLVVSPWRRAELARRWAGFLERARRWPLFAPLIEHPMPSGVQVMTYSAQNGWRGYGARRRWDWSYAASIITAMENGDFDLSTGTETPSAATVGSS